MTIDEVPDSPWATFLRARLELIASWINEGKMPAEIREELEVDPEQIALLIQTAIDKGLVNRPHEASVRAGQHLAALGLFVMDLLADKKMHPFEFRGHIKAYIAEHSE